MVKQMEINKNHKLSKAAQARLKALDKRKVDTSDISEATPAELRELRQQLTEKRKKQMFSLRLSSAAITWWQGLGSGYTGVMARLLDEARHHPEWIKTVL